MTVTARLFLSLWMATSAGDFWPRVQSRSPEVQRWLIEGAERRRMNQRAHLEEAEIAIAEAVKLAPLDVRARREHADVLYELGRPAECVGELRAARALDETLEPAATAWRLGVCLARCGQYEAAAQEYRQALRAPAGQGVLSAFAHWNLGDVEMALGHLEAALAHYERALAQAGGARAERAGARVPEGPAIELSLAVAYDRADEGRRALLTARDAVARGVLAELERTDTGILFIPEADRFYALGLALEASGRQELAVAQWEAFLRAAPQSPWAARARAHLGNKE